MVCRSNESLILYYWVLLRIKVIFIYTQPVFINYKAVTIKSAALMLTIMLKILVSG